ncbi:cytochrome P450 71D8-like [Senna tora]|uniref:Cytochrome P450 71D8-like n=1 Tax=Senna tora TaxID=362788 RepID=A0A834X8S8_9FABA|nr:cytochrome P450 71D8-like [Senna tora]
MEEAQFFLPIIFFLLLIFLFIILWLAKSHEKPKSKAKIMNVVPGPWKLPVLGNLHQLFAASSLPHHGLRKLSLKYGPLMQLQLGEMPAVVVSSPDMAKEIMKTHDLAFVQRPQVLSSQIMFYGSQDIAFAPYGEYWRQMRKICTMELLTAKRVQSFSFVRKDEVSNLIKSIKSSVGSEIDLSSKIYTLTSVIVARVTFGKKAKDHQELLALLKAALALFTGFDLSDLFPSMKHIHFITGLKSKLEKMHQRIDKALENLIKDIIETQGENKGLSGEENLIEVLLRLQQSHTLEIPITINNIKAVIWDLFAAGTDTSGATIEWAMSELMKNPIVMKKAQAEIRKAFKGKKGIHEDDINKLSYLNSVIKETLRLHPPVPLLLPRECREACKINGYEIPIKTKVIVNAWAIGRDPKYWYEAERFMPERFNENGVDFRGTNFEYIPFGAGRRMCPGMSFGLASVELPLANLLYHFDWVLPNGIKAEDLDMTEALGASVGRENNLCLIPKPYFD